MELHQLRYFVAVAETGGFVRAARRCSIAQPSLSQQIMKLEQELGQQLFERVGRSVRLTGAGAALLPRARSILAEVQDARTLIAGEVERGKGRLTIGFIPTLAQHIFPGATRGLHDAFPEASISFVEALTERLIEGMIALEYDLCFLSLPIESRLIATEALADEPLLLAIPAGHPLAADAEVPMEALREVPFVALDEEHCLGQQIEAFCYQRRINPTVVCRAAQIDTVQLSVAAGMGVALVPQLIAERDQSGDCIYRPIAGERPSRAIVAAWHASRRQSRLALHLIASLREQLSR